MALAAFITTAEQDDNDAAFLTKIDAVARSKKEAQFADPIAYRVTIAEISVLQAKKPLEDSPPGAGVTQTVKPVRERFFSGRVTIDDHGLGR